MGIVRYRADEIPPLTKEDRIELKALAERPDSAIDYSDMPELRDEQLARMRPSPFYKPIKKQTSIRLDADVLDINLH